MPIEVPKIQIIDGPLPPCTPGDRSPGAGAVVWFEGIVRGEEEGRPIAALDYEVYEPMALRVLMELASELASAHGLSSIEVQHSRGRVPDGACSFRLRIASRHRKAAIVAMDQFIDRLKQDVPIWKSPLWAQEVRP